MKKFDTMGEDWTVTETGTGTDRNGPESGTGTGMGRKPEHETAEIQEKDSLQ